MSNTPPNSEPAPAPPRSQGRPVAFAGLKEQRRGGLALLGLALVLIAAAGFWLLFRSIDERSEYLMAARTIERWEVVGAEDFDVVEANVGPASAMAADRGDAVQGKWATGRIPAGTIITEGLFETPPLSAESEADRVLLQVTLPSEEAPFGSFDTGDTLALLGREYVDDQAGEGALSPGPLSPGPLALIGVLRLEFVSGDDIFYVVTPEQALQIKSSVDRYLAASDRTMLKLGVDMTVEDLVEALEQQAVAQRAPAGTEAGAGPDFEAAGSR